MTEASRPRLRKGTAVLALGTLAAVCLAGGCAPKPAKKDPVPAAQMQEYDRMMKSGGLPRPAGAAGPMQGGPGGMRPGPGGMMPGAPGTGGTSTAPMVAPPAQPPGSR